MNAIQKAPFGSIEEILDIQGRIQSTYTSLFPNSALLTNDEAFALAQVGFMQGLDVFNKEIYFLKTQTRSIGVMPGIRGLRKHAHRQIRYEGGRSANFWFEFYMVIDKEEKARVGAGDTDLVICAHLCDSVTMNNYLSMRQSIFGNFLSWKDLLKLATGEGDAVAIVQKAVEESAKSILGNPPIITSYGIIKNSELKHEGTALAKPLQMTNTQNPYYMAEIRAERKALYKRFDLEKQFGAIVADAEQMVEAIDGQVDADEEIAPEPVVKDVVPRTEKQNLVELGFGG